MKKNFDFIESVQDFVDLFISEGHHIIDVTIYEKPNQPIKEYHLTKPLSEYKIAELRVTKSSFDMRYDDDRHASYINDFETGSEESNKILRTALTKKFGRAYYDKLYQYEHERANENISEYLKYIYQNEQN